MRFGILGPLEVVGDGGSRVELGARRQRAVLATLLVHLNEVVSLDHLIDDVWGETPPHAATASLQAYVSNLRRALEPERARRTPARILVTEPPGYALRVDPDDVDACRFERDAGQGRAALAAGDARGALDSLDGALEQWRGDALAEFAYDAFATAEISRLDELRARVEEDRVDALLAMGDNAGACVDLDRLITRHPLRERLRTLQMLALYRSGRQAESLWAYDHARALLAEELGLDPGPELEQLRHQILTHDPSLQTGTSAISVAAPPVEPEPHATAPSARPTSTFVGRETTLGHLRDALDEAVAGTSRIVLIGGEAGIGKSRLASELVARAQAAGVLVAWGRCHDDEGAPPLWPWVQVLRGLGATANDVPDHVRPALAAMLPELGEPGITMLDVDAARFRLYDAVRELIERSAAAQPALVVLEDIHWADVTSLRLLRFFAVELRTASLMIVATFRDPEPFAADPTVEAITDVLAEPNVAHTTLAGLSSQDVAELIRDDTDADDASREIADEIHRRTDGNPFFVTELVRLLTSERRVSRDAAASDIPTAVGDVIRRRIRRLPDDVQTVLGVASVIGREFDVDVLRRSCGLDTDTTLDVLELALLTRIVIAPDGGRYRFAHALVSETLYADLNPVRRARLHARVGEAIESAFESDLEPRVSQLAHHFGRARAGPRAAEYARRAANQAEQRLAFDDAIAHWQSTLAALDLDGAPRPAERAEILLHLAGAMRRAGDEAGGSAVNDEALAVSERSGDLILLAEAALAYGEIGLWQVRPYGTVDDRVVTAISRALAGTDDGDSALRARLLVGLAVALYYDEEQRQRGEALAREGAAMARRLGDPRLLTETLVELVVMLDASPDLPQQLAMAEELAELEGPDIPIEVGTTARMRRARLRLASGDASRLRADIDRAATEAQIDRQPLVQMWATWAQTTVAFLGGRLTEAESLADAAFELHQRVGIWGATETYGLHMMLIWREQGRMVEMAPFVEPILKDTVHPGAPKMLGIFAIERGAIDEIAAILGPDPLPQVHDFTWLAELCVTAELTAAAHLPCAADLYRTLLPFQDRVVTMDGTFFCMGAASRYLGLLAGVLNRSHDAVMHLERAVEIDDRVGAIPWSVRSRWHLSRTLREHDPRRAREVLIEAHRTATDHDLAALQAMTGTALDDV